MGMEWKEGGSGKNLLWYEEWSTMMNIWNDHVAIS